MKLHWIGFALAPLLFSQQQPESKASLEGSCFNLNTGAPLKKAVVLLRGPSVEAVRETNAAGHFAFAGLEAGSYELTARRDGYLEKPYGPHRFAFTPILLAAGDHKTGIDFKLPPMSIVSGRVLNEDGEPVMNLDVTVLRARFQDGERKWIEASSATTNDRGEYRIPMLTPGRYLLRTDSRKSAMLDSTAPLGQALPQTADTFYAVTYYGGTLDETRAIPIEVHVGEEARGMDIQIVPGKAFRIRGTVAKPAGMGFVLAWSRKGETLRHIESHTDPAESRFQLSGMLPGSYTLYAEPEDSDVTGLARQSIEITDHHIDGVVLTLAASSNVRGAIKVDGTVALSDLHKLSIGLHGHQSISFPAEPTPVAANLTFVLKDVVPAPFGVDVNGLPNNCYVKSILYNGFEILGAENEVFKGGTLEIVVSPTAAQLEGTVTDKDGKPAPGAAVALIPKDAALSPKSVTANENGSFRFGSLKPGDYRAVAIEDIEPGTLPDPDVLKAFESLTEAVTLGSGERKNIQIKAIPDQPGGRE